MSTTASNSARASEPAEASAPPPALTARSLTSPPRPASATLPDSPLVVIEPSKSWGSLNLREIWVSRELLYYLTLRDVKVRYKQTFFGVAWIVMQPLLTTIIFTIFLGMLARVPSNGVAYPLFVFVGLLPWTFFSSAVTTSGNSLVSNTALVTKVYFPRAIVPLASIGARLADFVVTFIILIPLMIYYRAPLTWHLLMLPLLFLLLTLLALGCGMLVSALNVKYRDVVVALPVVIQLWMYVSPVLYPSSLVPPAWRWAYSLNPLAGIIDGFRASLLGMPFDWFSLGVATAATLILLPLSARLFKNVERSFADII